MTPLPSIMCAVETSTGCHTEPLAYHSLCPATFCSTNVLPHPPDSLVPNPFPLPHPQATSMDTALAAASDPAYTAPQLPDTIPDVSLQLPWWFTQGLPAAGAAPSPPPAAAPQPPAPVGVPPAGPYTVRGHSSKVAGAVCVLGGCAAYACRHRHSRQQETILGGGVMKPSPALELILAFLPAYLTTYSLPDPAFPSVSRSQPPPPDLCPHGRRHRCTAGDAG